MYNEISGEILTNEKEKYVNHVPGSLMRLLKLNKRRVPDVINEHILGKQTLKTNVTRLPTVNQAIISHICAFLELWTIAFQVPFSSTFLIAFLDPDTASLLASFIVTVFPLTGAVLLTLQSLFRCLHSNFVCFMFSFSFFFVILWTLFSSRF